MTGNDNQLVAPAKYLKTEWGLIALVPKYDQSGNDRDVFVGEDVAVDIFGGQVMGILTGNVLLPIPEELLDFVIEHPAVQISVLSKKMIDEEHFLVNLDLPALYQLKGMWRGHLLASASANAGMQGGSDVV